jgi:hypothetical protein
MSLTGKCKAITKSISDRVVPEEPAELKMNIVTVDFGTEVIDRTMNKDGHVMSSLIVLA